MSLGDKTSLHVINICSDKQHTFQQHTFRQFANNRMLRVLSLNHAVVCLFVCLFVSSEVVIYLYLYIYIYIHSYHIYIYISYMYMYDVYVYIYIYIYIYI